MGETDRGGYWVLFWWAMLSKSLIQFSVVDRAMLPPYCLTWGPNYGLSNEDNGDLLQKVPGMHCHTQCLWPCSRPLLTHASVGDWWTLTGKPGSVSCGVTASFSWVLVCTKFCLCPPGSWSVSPVLCKFWRLYGGVKGNLFQQGLCHTQVCCTQSPAPVAGHCWPVCPKETFKHSKAGLAQALLGLLVCTRFCLSPLSVSGGYRFWF